MSDPLPPMKAGITLPTASVWRAVSLETLPAAARSVSRKWCRRSAAAPSVQSGGNAPGRNNGSPPRLEALATYKNRIQSVVGALTKQR